MGKKKKFGFLYVSVEQTIVFSLLVSVISWRDYWNFWVEFNLNLMVV
jgi:hypothetical protein